MIPLVCPYKPSWGNQFVEFSFLGWRGYRLLSHSIIVLAFPPPLFLSFSFPLLCRGKNPFSILPPRPLKRGRCLHPITHAVKPIEKAGPLLEFISQNASTTTSPAPFYTSAYAASPFRNIFFPFCVKEALSFDRKQSL